MAAVDEALARGAIDAFDGVRACFDRFSMREVGLP